MQRLISSLDLQLAAEQTAAYHGGYRRCPDALFMRGVAMFSRANMAEACKDIAQAAAIARAGKHTWCSTESMSEAVVNLMLGLARNSSKGANKMEIPPLSGRWVKLRRGMGDRGKGVAGKGPRDLMAAATCRVGSVLYFFGGLKYLQGGESGGVSKYVSSAESICGIKPPVSDISEKDTFFALDLVTKSWTSLKPTHVTTGVTSPEVDARGGAAKREKKGRKGKKGKKKAKKAKNAKKGKNAGKTSKEGPGDGGGGPAWPQPRCFALMTHRKDPSGSGPGWIYLFGGGRWRGGGKKKRKATRERKEERMNEKTEKTEVKLTPS